MLKKILFFAVIFCLNYISNAQFIEDFTDGNLSFSPLWTGDTNLFIINTEQELQSNGNQSSSRNYISTPIHAYDSILYKVNLSLDFNPSSTNFAQLFILSDDANLTNTKNGYYLQIGEASSTKDSIDFFKLENGSITKLFNSDACIYSSSKNEIALQLTQNKKGVWQLISECGTEKDTTVSVLDTTIKMNGYTGLVAKYSTGSRFDKYRFSNIEVELDSAHSIIDTTTKDTTITDTTNNTPIPIDSSNSIGVSPSKTGAILITELLPDPTPIVGLPDAEFIELYNNSDDTLNLSGLILSDASKSTLLPDYTFLPRSFVILTNKSDTSKFTQKNTIGITLPSLNNGGDSISLKDSSGNTLIDFIYYNTSTYKEASKDNGGYSIERIILKKCDGEAAWRASWSPEGGSPGTYIDSSSKYVQVDLPSFNYRSETVQIIFENTPDFYSDLKINGIQSKKISFFNSIATYEASSLEENKFHSLEIDSITSCLLDKVISYKDTLLIKSQITRNDVVINEILFDPFVNAEDFVELYNNSEKIIPIKDLRLIKVQDNKLSTLYPLNISKKYFQPKEYLCFTKDLNELMSNYPLTNSSTSFQIDQLPSWNNDEGNVVIGTIDTLVIDSFYYNEDFHFSILSDVEGVSLERINFNIESNSSSNWHSAAEAVGYATPGYKNSQINQQNAGDEFTIEPDVISPNEDGYNDFALIKYSFEETGSTATVKIFDINGRLITTLANNQLLGSSGSIKWDGTNENGQIMQTGNYIALIDLFRPGQLDQKKYKKRIVLSRQ